MSGKLHRATSTNTGGDGPSKEPSHSHDHSHDHDHDNSAEKKSLGEARADLMVHRTDAHDATSRLEEAAAMLGAPDADAFEDKVDKARDTLDGLESVQIEGSWESAKVEHGMEEGDNSRLDREIKVLHDQVFRWQNNAYNAFVTEANNNELRRYPHQPTRSEYLWEQAGDYGTWALLGVDWSYGHLLSAAERMAELAKDAPSSPIYLEGYFLASEFDDIVEGYSGSDLAYLTRIARKEGAPEWLEDKISTNESWADFTKCLDDDKASTVYPKVADLDGEIVMVDTAEEEEEARTIITRIEGTYGIDISSLKLNEAVSEDYKDSASEAVRKSLRKGAWEMAELRAVDRALAHYAPILGANRATSTRAGADQEVDVIGRGHQAITGANLDTTTFGEAFGDSDAFGLFSPGTTTQVDFADQGKQLEGTTVHELAHLLLEYKEIEFLNQMDFWASGSTSVYDDGSDSQSRQDLRDAATAAGVEPPITNYGTKSSNEDLAEAAMYYFVDTATLKSNAPVRWAFMEKVVSEWKPPAK